MLMRFLRRYMATSSMIILWSLLILFSCWAIAFRSSLAKDSLNTWYAGYARHFYVYLPETSYTDNFTAALSDVDIGSSLLIQEFDSYPVSIRLLFGSVVSEDALRFCWRDSFLFDNIPRASVGHKTEMACINNQISYLGMEYLFLGALPTDASTLLDYSIIYCTGDMKRIDLSGMFTVLNPDPKQLNDSFTLISQQLESHGYDVEEVVINRISTLDHFGISTISCLVGVLSFISISILCVLLMRFWLGKQYKALAILYLIGYSRIERYMYCAANALKIYLFSLVTSLVLVSIVIVKAAFSFYVAIIVLSAIAFFCCFHIIYYLFIGQKEEDYV